MGVIILVGALQNTAISYRLSEVGVPVICRDDFQKSTSRIVGVVGGVVGFSALSLLIWSFLRHRSRGAPFHVVGPGMDENIRQTQGAPVRFFGISLALQLWFKPPVLYTDPSNRYIP